MNMFSERVQSSDVSASRDDRREATRDRVLEVAESCFRRDGYPATTIRLIAAEAGFSTGTVMGVGSKPQLLAEVMDQTIARLNPGSPGSGSLSAGMPDSAGPPEVTGASGAVRTGVGGVVEPAMRVFAADEDLARHFLGALISETATSATMGELGKTLAHDLAREMRASGLPRERCEAAGRTLRLVYFGGLMEWAGGSSDPERIIAGLETAAEQLLGGAA